jgi:hypothetical protein
MKGDFSRGHQPDRKRGREYRRVLLQQGRLLLDSDVASLVDAIDGQLRDLANLGCPEGSPDYGWLVTPGRLLAIFDEIEDVVSQSAGTVEFYRDYSQKYRDRVPSLFLGATSGVAGTARIRLRSEVNGSVDFWVRGDSAINVTINGVANLLAVPAGPDFVRVPVVIAGPVQDLDIELDAGEQFWIGLIEETHNATATPEFSVASGLYFLHGLILENPADGYWPDVSYPPTAFPVFPDLPGLAANDRIVAYLEGWERHITRIEDAGIMEVALGTGPDTCTRTQALGQVKLAVSGAMTPDEIIDAFHARQLTDGTLDVTTPPAPPNPDPCALPVAGGYTGLDNRLYRFEVHVGGALFNTLFKWSRDNGSELFTVSSTTGATLTFPAGSGLMAGDLVEVLSERIDLADANLGVLTNAPDFTAPDRAVGALVRLVDAPAANADEETFTLVDPEDESLPAPLNLADFGDPNNPVLKVRRWHGLFRPQGADPFVTEIEDGIEVSLTGTFTPGDYWLYEARVAATQANGPWQITPHGPERLFTPLALLEYNGPNEPLELIAWLDDRFSPICELNADDIEFDGDRIGTDSDTVQEVIEELWERERGGCCDRTLQPNDENLEVRINAILGETQGDLTICLRRGVYDMDGAVQVAGRRVAVKGCPAAVIRYTDDGSRFFVGPEGHLVLEDLTILVQEGLGTVAIVDLLPDSFGVTARSTGFISAAPSGGQVSIRQAGRVPSVPAAGDPLFTESGLPDPDQPEIDVEDCVFVAAWAISADALGSLRMARCAAYTTTGGVQCPAIARTDIEESSLVTGRNLAFTAFWTAEELSSVPDAALDQLTDAPQVVDGGFAVLHGYRWDDVTVERCTIAGGRFGIAVAIFMRARCEGNSYICRDSAIYLFAALTTKIHTEVVRLIQPAVQIAIHIPGFGSDLEIVNCSLEGVVSGIVLQEDAGRPTIPVNGQHRDVLIKANTISASGIGILNGSIKEALTQVIAVRIEENDVTSQQFGIVLQHIGQENPRPEVRVGENFVRAPRCLHVEYLPCTIQDNQFVFPGSGTPGTGVTGAYFRWVFGLFLAGNRFQLEGQQQVDPLIAVHLDNGSQAVITGNLVAASVRTNAVQALNHPHLQISENDFGDSDCVFDNCDEIRFDGNQAGAVSITRASDGTVRSNRVESLRITELSGAWQVNDNRATGEIVIIPRLAGLTFPIFTSASSHSYTLSAINSLSTGQPPAGVILAPDPGNAGMTTVVASSSAGNTNWAVDWTNAVVAEVVGNFDDLIFVNPAAPVLVLNVNETIYEAQVVANWCQTLQVGLGNPSYLGGTLVVVTSNRAVQSISITFYLECIVSHNASPNISAWFGSAGNLLTDRNVRT